MVKDIYMCICLWGWRIYTYVYVYEGVYKYVTSCGGWRSTLDASLNCTRMSLHVEVRFISDVPPNCSSSYVLWQSLSLKLKITSSTRVAGQWAPGIPMPLLFPVKEQVSHVPFFFLLYLQLETLAPHHVVANYKVKPCNIQKRKVARSD